MSTIENTLNNFLKEITMSDAVPGLPTQLTPEPINRLFGNEKKKKKKKRGSKCSK